MYLSKPFYCSLIVLACFFLGSNALFAGKKMSLNLENSSDFPYVIDDSNEFANPPGSIIELLKDVAAELDVDLSLNRVPWKRCLAEMEKNTSDGCFSASYKAKREKFGVYPKINGEADASKRLMDSSYMLYSLKSKKVSWTNDAFEAPMANPKIVTIRGFSVIEKLKNMGAKVLETDSVSSALRMVALGRVDAAVLIGLSADFEISSNADLQEKILKNQTPVSSKAYYLMFSHAFFDKDQDFAHLFWEKIKEKRMQGKIDEFSKKYFETSKK